MKVTISLWGAAVMVIAVIVLSTAPLAADRQWAVSATVGIATTLGAIAAVMGGCAIANLSVNSGGKKRPGDRG